MLFKNRSWWKLPSPIELGKSDCDALPSKMFEPNSQEYTWEDWREEVKRKHPIKYFCTQTIPSVINIKITLPINHMIYYLESHIIPNKRYHMLDLRQPKGWDIDAYRYGWCDVPTKMLYAWFNLLDDFVNKEMKHLYLPPEDDIENKKQREIYLEILDIHKWWTKDRKKSMEKYHDLLDKSWLARKSNDPNSSELRRQSLQLDRQIEDKTDEMLMRLIKVRRHLWS